MGRRSQALMSIPQLKKIGLMPVKTVGDGNCLFNALSDQLHGDDSLAAEYRATVVQYMRANKEDYIPFIDLGHRRNPKRKAAGRARSEDPELSVETLAHQQDIAFEKRMKDMAQGGVWGDNHELVAFSRAFVVDILIWSVAISTWFHIAAPDTAGPSKPSLYIVHHNYEHYSSIRNINGPLTGLPEIVIQGQTAEAIAQMRGEFDVEEWTIDTIMKILPYPLNQPESRAHVGQVLKKCKGNMESAIEMLLPDSSPGSTSSSSREREYDSDDEEAHKPHKKRDRRASRPNPFRSNLAMPAPDSENMISPNPMHLTAALQTVANDKSKYDPDETEEENWKDQLLKDSSSESSSSASRTSSPASKDENTTVPKIRLKLSAPSKEGHGKDLENFSDSGRSSQSYVADNEADHEDSTKPVQKGIARPRIIAKPRGRLMAPYDRAFFLKQQSARDSDNESTLGRTSSMKRLDSSIEAITI